MGLSDLACANKHLQCSSSKENEEEIFHARKPKHDDPILVKERFIHAKVFQENF